MIIQERLSPLTFSKKDNNASSSVLIDQFLKEALQILRHADTSLCKNPTVQDEDDLNHESELNSSHDKGDSVTWQLNLTPTMMTLDTNILTISGLKKVLELIRINVIPEPPKFRQKRKVNSDRFDIFTFHRIIEPVLRLSAVAVVPRSELANQFNIMQLMRHCVQSFVECGYSFFLDVHSLQANTEMILSQPSAVKEHTVETLLTFSICTLMIRHTSLHHGGDINAANSLIQAYYGQARMLLQDLFDVHHISVVQSMYILSLYPHGHNHLFSPTQTPSPLLTLAIRMALTMDLHRIDTQHSKDSDQKERLRRLAWILLCADYYADWNSTGQTGLINVQDWHVDFPQPMPRVENPRPIEYFSQYCRIVMIRKLELFKSSYMISLQSLRALESGLDEQLFQSYFNTPEGFRLQFDAPNPKFTKTDIESLNLYELYSHTQIFARIPFLPKHYFDNFIADLDASRCSDLNDIYNRFGRPPIPGNMQGTFATPYKPTFPYSNSILPSFTDTDSELGFYCLVGFLAVLDNYTQILEALASIDPIGCGHNPIYGIMLTSHLYMILDRSCQNLDVRSLCQINLSRTSRILKQARSIYGDPALVFLDVMLARHNVSVNEKPLVNVLVTQAHDIVQMLKQQANSAYSYQHYSHEDEEDDESPTHYIGSDLQF